MELTHEPSIGGGDEMTVEDLRPRRMRLRASYVFGVLVSVVAILLVGTAYYYARPEIHPTTTAASTYQSTTRTTTDLRVEAINFVQNYRGKKGEDTVLTLLAASVLIAYPEGLDLFKDPETIHGWDAKHLYDDTWEVTYYLRTYREDSKWSFAVDLADKRVWARNDSAQVILDMVDKLGE